MSTIQLWLAGAGAIIAAIVGMFFKGRSEGKKAEKAKQAETDLRVERQRNETNKQANEVREDIGRLPDDDVQQRLRDKYSRD